MTSCNKKSHTEKFSPFFLLMIAAVPIGISVNLVVSGRGSGKIGLKVETFIEGCVSMNCHVAPLWNCLLKIKNKLIMNCMS